MNMTRHNNTICDTLRQVIRDSGISMYRLEKESGVNRLCVARFLNGKAMYSHHLDVLCDYFGLELKATKAKKGETK